MPCSGRIERRSPSRLCEGEYQQGSTASVASCRSTCVIRLARGSRAGPHSGGHSPVGLRCSKTRFTRTSAPTSTMSLPSTVRHADWVAVAYHPIEAEARGGLIGQRFPDHRSSLDGSFTMRCKCCSSSSRHDGKQHISCSTACCRSLLQLERARVLLCWSISVG